MVVGSAGVRRWPGVILGGLVLECVPHQGENGCFEPSVAQFVPQMKCKRLESMSWQLVVSRYHWKMAETVCCI